MRRKLLSSLLTFAMAFGLLAPLSQSVYAEETVRIQGVPLLNQANYNGCIPSVGCTVTSVAMVFQYYGYNVSPYAIRDYLGSCNMSWSGILALAPGLTVTEIIPGFDRHVVIKNAIRAGKPVITFTNNWDGTGISHAVVITGYNQTGYFINNPNGGAAQHTVYDNPQRSIDYIKIYNGTPGTTVMTLDNNSRPSDFDGDGLTDIALYRPTNATRYITKSTGGSTTIGFGSVTDIPVHGGDYDGDGTSDVAVYRPSTGTWYIQRSTLGGFTYGFGSATDIPINGGDFDGDGKTDIALYRPSNATRYIMQSTDGYREWGFGSVTDIPVHGGDYDGDGKADIAVYRPSTGTWYLSRSTAGYLAYGFGSSTDLPINGGDFDGDGKTDIALYRPSNATRYIMQSTAGYREWGFGSVTDTPVHGGDYDGDGKADIAVYRASTGTWYLSRSTAGYYSYGFGSVTDIPM